MSESFLDKVRTVESYLEKKGKNSESTKRNIQYSIRHFEKFLFVQYAERGLNEIVEELKIHSNPQEALENLFQNYIDYSENMSNPELSIKNRVSNVVNLLKYLKIPFAKDDLYESISIKKSTLDDIKPLTKEMIQGLFAHTTTLKQRALYYLLVSSGIRLREALGLRVKDVDKSHSRFVIHVGKEFSKFHKERYSICSFEAMPLLEKQMQGKNQDDFIFEHNKNMQNAVVNQDIVFQRLRKRAGLDTKRNNLKYDYSLHGLRAFFITQFEKTFSGCGHALSGHTKYMQTYERFTINEKIDMYIKTEKYLLINTENESNEMQEIKKKLEVFDKLSNNPKFKKFLDALEN